MYLADLHIHSTFSDGKLTIPEIVDLYGQKGYGAIAITDHLCETDTTWGRFAQWLNLTLTRSNFPIYMGILRSEARRAWEDYQMLVIPGLEITKNTVRPEHSAHVLALGVTEFISADQSVEKVLEEIRKAGGLSIAAHPRMMPNQAKQTYYLWNHRDQLADRLDAWEVGNSRTWFDEVAETDLPKLACSDLHRLSDFESWKTVVRGERSKAGLIQAIKRQELSFKMVREKSYVGTLCEDQHDYLGELSFAHPYGDLVFAEAFSSL